MSHLVNFAAADQLVARPKAAMQFHPAAIKPAVATAPAPGKLFPAAVFQPGVVQGPVRPLAAAPTAPFVTMPVARRTTTSSTPMTTNPIPMDIGRFFQTPLGNDSDETTYTTTTRRRPVRSFPAEPEAVGVKPEQKAEVPESQSTTPPVQAADGKAAESAPKTATQAQSEPQPDIPAEASSKTPSPAPPQIQSQMQTRSVEPVQLHEQTPPTKTPSPAPVRKANEFPQCGVDRSTSEPALVRKMFASILKITDINSQGLRQQEMVWMAYPTLALAPQGKAMHTLIGHPMHNTDAPSSFCQEGNGLKVTMDVSHDSMVRAKVGNSIVAHLVRTGNGAYISTGSDGKVTHYTLEGVAAPRATASTAMATR